MVQNPMESEWSHASVASLHVSSVQVSGSEQSRATPVQAPEELQVSLGVQKRPSSQLTPVRGVHVVVLVAASQPWQVFVRFWVPFA